MLGLLNTNKNSKCQKKSPPKGVSGPSDKCKVGVTVAVDFIGFDSGVGWESAMVYSIQCTDPFAVECQVRKRIVLSSFLFFTSKFTRNLNEKMMTLLHSFLTKSNLLGLLFCTL